MKEYRFSIFADYYQFYIQDDDPEFGDLSDSWTDESVSRLLAVAPHVIGIGTVRNLDVPVEIVISEKQPELVLEDWDQITRASLRVDTGRIVVAGCTDYYPNAARVNLEKGIYQAIICYGNLDKVSEDGLTGEDYYKIFLFHGIEVAPEVIIQRRIG